MHGTIMADFTGSSISGYQDWYNAKYGTISVRQFAKPRIARVPHGMTCAASVTPGKANDPPYLKAMLAMAPRGSGDVSAGAQYGGVENCQAMKDSGHRPVIEPRSDYTIKGDDAGVEVARFLEERPRRLPLYALQGERCRGRLPACYG